MPVCMIKRRINMAPIAWIIYQDHESNRGATKYVEGVEPLIHLFDDLEINQFGDLEMKHRYCLITYVS